MTDKRMRWVLITEDTDENTNEYAEYEIASEGFVNGLFNYGNGSILCAALDFHPDQSGLYYYLLKIKTAAIWSDDKWARQYAEATSDGYVFRKA